MQENFSPKKYYIKTFGCQANMADSSTMAGILEALGFEKFPEPCNKTEDENMLEVFQHTDLVIINTCSVRQKSEDKVYGLGRLLKKLSPNYSVKPFIVMSGCMVGSVTGERARYAFSDLHKKTPWVDAYINPSQINTLPNILVDHKVLDSWALQKFRASDVNPKPESPNTAFVNISYGCDNFCTFCVVPYSRGQEISRSEKEILHEINHLVSRGVTEITLCGQNVNSWGLSMSEKFEVRTGSDQKIPFADLLHKIHAIENVSKITFLSSNPFDFTQDLIEAITLPKISNYLHIAVQSGSNEVLKRMNRRHTIQDFYKLVEMIKKAKPQVELGTDIIVGFPGETEEQFNETVQLFETVTFNVAFISIYSPRKGTPAEKFFKDDVPFKEKKRRHAVLTKAWQESKKSSNAPKSV